MTLAENVAAPMNDVDLDIKALCLPFTLVRCSAQPKFAQFEAHNTLRSISDSLNTKLEPFKMTGLLAAAAAIEPTFPLVFILGWHKKRAPHIFTIFTTAIEFAGPKNPATHNSATMQLMLWRDYNATFQNLAKSFHKARNLDEWIRLPRWVQKKKRSMPEANVTAVNLPSFANGNPLSILQSTFADGCNGHADGVFLDVPSGCYELQLLINAVTTVVNMPVQYVWFNQFSYYYPTEMFYQCMSSNATVWVRSPGYAFYCILVLSGNLILTQAGCGNVIKGNPGDLLVLPANLYTARHPEGMTAPMTLTFVM